MRNFISTQLGYLANSKFPFHDVQSIWTRHIHDIRGIENKI